MKRKKLSFGARLGLWFLSFLLGIALFVSAITTISIASVRVLTSENTIQEIVKMIISAPGHVHHGAVSGTGNGGMHAITRPGVRTYAIPRRDNESNGFTGVIVDKDGNIISGDGSTIIVGEDGTIIIDGESYETVVGEDGTTIIVSGSGDVDIEDILGNNDLSGNSGNANSATGMGGLLGGNITDEIIESMFSELEQQLGGDLGISLEEVNNMLEQSTVKDFIADKAASLITDFYTGEVSTTFEAEEIKQLIEENSALIESVLGQPLPEEVTDMVVQWVEQSEIIQQVEKEGLQGILESSGVSPDQILGGNASGKPSDSGNALGEQLGDMLGSEGIAGSVAGVAGAITGGELQGIDNFSDILTLLRSATSQTNFIISIAVCVVLMVLILLVNIRQISKGLRRCGYPLMFAGSLFIVCLVVKPLLPAGIDPVMTVLNLVLTKTMTVNGIVFAIGAVLFIAGIVVAIAMAGKNEKAVPVAVGVGAPAAEAFSEALEPLAEPAAAPFEEAPAQDAPAEAENTDEAPEAAEETEETV